MKMKWAERYTAAVARAERALLKAQDEALAEGLSRLEKVCRQHSVVVSGGHVEAADGGEAACEEAEAIVQWLMHLGVDESNIHLAEDSR